MTIDRAATTQRAHLTRRLRAPSASLPQTFQVSSGLNASLPPLYQSVSGSLGWTKCVRAGPGLTCCAYFLK